MPQLDIVPFASNYLWFYFFFFIFFFFFLQKILPQISQWLKIQNKQQINQICWLFVYDYMTIKKDNTTNELLIKFANYVCCLVILLKNIDFKTIEFLTEYNCTVYEKSSIYTMKKCFLYK